ncbi:SDR family oxidoreductase [Nonomuraea spiralis]|uniref:SDR family oxidoreductase n=1 Tax=Nonomuraea TaxID=83681 RepID=UPI000F7742DA|nr:SDR family oxidoreductase [Nonomuraea sp. WAC 01424]RSN10455.1 epimerase [Nonomuraea sp. WAC 01424]
MRILVTGATGTLGRALLPVLLKAGHRVRALSRTRHESRGGVEWMWGDLASGKGVAEAVRQVEAIAHLATGGRKGSAQVDLAGTRTLVAAARAAGVAHVLLTSVVGADRAPGQRHKLEAERLVKESGMAWTVVRATPFHQRLDGLLRDFSVLPVLPVDRSLPWQPVHVNDVALRLAALLAGGPACAVIEYGGPQVLDTEELARIWLEARHLRRPCLPVRFPGRLAAAQRAGAFTTDAEPSGRITWHDYLFPPPPAPSDDFAEEHTASPTSPANQPEHDPSRHVYGGDEGYQRPTRG